MRRYTEVTPVEENTSLLQTKLNYFWRLIEDRYEDEWRVEYNGTVVLNVTEELLTKVLSDNSAEASMYFGAYEEHNPEYQKYEWVNFPEELIGLYSITGIYDTHFRRVDGPRSYSFEQGY